MNNFCWSEKISLQKGFLPLDESSGLCILVLDLVCQRIDPLGLDRLGGDVECGDDIALGVH
jgi:hypothetical protein